MKNTILYNIKYYQDYILFFLILMAGVFTKIWFAIQKGKKPTLSWFLAEGIISFFVAFSVYVLCDQYLKLDKHFTYVICAWGGSFSTIIHSKVEELISVFFDALKNITKSKLT